MSNERLPTKALTIYLRNLINKVYKMTIHIGSLSLEDM